MKKSAISILVVAGILMLMSACRNPIADNPDKSDIAQNSFDPGGDLDGDGILNKDDSDIDGDGLSNDAETNTHHTSPYIADTDGDGWSDLEEVTNYVASYPRKFSPLIADLPGIELVLRSQPQIEMVYSTTTGSTDNYSLSESVGFTSTQSNSNSFTQTTADEYGWNVETGIEFGTTGGEPHVVGHVNVGAHGTYTKEDSYSWSSSQSIENSRAVDRAHSQGTSDSLSQSGGKISISASFRNTSNIAYKIGNISLSVYKLDPYTENYIVPIGTLTSATGLNISLDPQSQQENDGVFIFENSSLTVGKILELLDDSRGMIFSIAGYDITMEGKNFTQASTEVPLRTAKVIIDYGPGIGKKSEQYAVATKTAFNPDSTSDNDRFDSVPLETLLDRIGVVIGTGTTGANKGIQSVNGIAQDTTYNKYWYVVHRYQENGTDKVALYSIMECSYSLNDIPVKTGIRLNSSTASMRTMTGCPCVLKQ